MDSKQNAKEVWPVYVLDVARALERIAYDDSTAGQTFELYGPEKSLSKKSEI